MIAMVSWVRLTVTIATQKIGYMHNDQAQSGILVPPPLIGSS